VSFDILAVRTADDGADDQLHPVPAESSDELIVMRAEDGRSILRVEATQVVVREHGPRGPVEICRLSDARATVYVTDCRLAIACARFDKGGGWIGSPGMMLLLNAASTVRARLRSRGRTLVGHVRYSWLHSVGASSKQGWLDSEQVRLELVDRTAAPARRLVLELTLPKSLEAVPLAREIAHRAALHWLAPGRATTPDDRTAFERLVSPPLLSPEPKKFAFYTLPVHDGVEGSVTG
jgi:hypothetical protein